MNSPKMILEPYPSQTNCFHLMWWSLLSPCPSLQVWECTPYWKQTHQPFLTIQSLPSVVTPCTPCNDAVLLGGPGKWPGNLIRTIRLYFRLWCYLFFSWLESSKIFSRFSRFSGYKEVSLRVSLREVVGWLSDSLLREGHSHLQNHLKHP